MPIVNAKCTNCGADLRVDSDKEAMICEFCGSAFVVEKAIRNVSVTNHIQAANLTLVVSGKEFTVQAGVLIKYNGANADVVVPEGVTVIGEGAFEKCVGITSVVLPETVGIIDQRAFAHCTQLRRVQFPESLKLIENFAFNGCSMLKALHLPSRLVRIGDYAFYGCASLEEVTIPDSVERIGNSAFMCCDSLMKVQLPAVIQLSLDSFRREVLPPEYQPPKQQADTGGCYIATCVYGSYDCPQVWTLRRYRDNTLAANPFGRAFIRCYYAVSPKLVAAFGENHLFRAFWLRLLDRKIARLRAKGVADTPYKDK